MQKVAAPDRIESAEPWWSNLPQFMRSGRVILVVASAILCSSPGRSPSAAQEAAPGSKTDLKMHRMRAGKAEKDGWYHARSTDGHFRIRTPVPFNDYTVRDEDKNGRKISLYCIGATSKENYKFVAVEFPDIPQQMPPDVYLRDQADKFRKSGNTISDEKMFKYKGHQAMQFNAVNRRSAAVVRYVIVGGGVVFLVAEYPPASRKEVEPLATRFLDSLELTEVTPPASRK